MTGTSSATSPYAPVTARTSAMTDAYADLLAALRATGLTAELLHDADGLAEDGYVIIARSRRRAARITAQDDLLPPQPAQVRHWNLSARATSDRLPADTSPARLAQTVQALLST